MRLKKGGEQSFYQSSKFHKRLKKVAATINNNKIEWRLFDIGHMLYFLFEAGVKAEAHPTPAGCSGSPALPSRSPLRSRGGKTPAPQRTSPAQWRYGIASSDALPASPPKDPSAAPKTIESKGFSQAGGDHEIFSQQQGTDAISSSPFPHRIHTAIKTTMAATLSMVKVFWAKAPVFMPK